MAAHTLFVLGALTGLNLQWKSPPRQAENLPWADAARALGGLSLLAGGVLVAAWMANAGMALWLAPMTLPLLLAVPVVVWCGRPELGRALRRMGLLLTPEEVAPPRVLQRAWAEAGMQPVALPGPAAVPPTAALPIRQAVRAAA
jgi:membrane glycosyltransferase